MRLVYLITFNSLPLVFSGCSTFTLCSREMAYVGSRQQQTQLLLPAITIPLLWLWWESIFTEGVYSKDSCPRGIIWSSNGCLFLWHVNSCISLFIYLDVFANRYQDLLLWSSRTSCLHVHVVCYKKTCLLFHCVCGICILPHPVAYYSKCTFFVYMFYFSHIATFL
jgi:hypothetical protein